MRTDKPQAAKAAVDLDLPRFRLFPNWRMAPEFPWQIWAVGWLAIVKAVLWLSTDPVVPSPLAELLATKFLVMMAPFLLLGIGVWNLRRWAAWGLILITAADIAFIAVIHLIPQLEYWSSLLGGRYWAVTLVLLILNGPIGSVLILLASPAPLKTAGKYELLDHEGE